MEEMERDLREMFEVNRDIVLAPKFGGWTWGIRDAWRIRVEASKACAWIAMAIAKIREQRLEEEEEAG